MQDEPIQGVAATGQVPSGQVMTTFTFTVTSTGLKFYGMQLKQKLYGGTKVPATATARHGIQPAADPTQDACWLATHSVG